MNNSLVKLSLISMLALGANNVLANPNNNQSENANNAEQDEVIIIEMEPDLCPNLPDCIDLFQLELEEEL